MPLSRLKLFNGTLSSQKLFDKIINVKLYRVMAGPDPSAVEISITCPDGGVKPAVSLSFRLLPNKICYQMTVKIQNFSLRGSINIRTFNVISVDVGYRDGGTINLAGPIFSAYQESPNPDGVTVFEGVVVGDVGIGLFANQNYRLEFWADEISIQDLCARIADGLQLRLDTTSVDDSIMQETLKFPRHITARAQNGYAVVTWLNNVLHSYSLGRDWEMMLNQTNRGTGFSLQKRGNTSFTEYSPHAINVIVHNGTLKVIQHGITVNNVPVTPQNIDSSPEGENLVFLDCVKSASFSAQALTVQSLYNPNIIAGTLFYMDPVYFTGGIGLPNQLTEKSYNPDGGLYRAITVSVEFDTNGSTNNMQILAVPNSSYGNDDNMGWSLPTPELEDE